MACVVSTKANSTTAHKFSPFYYFVALGSVAEVVETLRSPLLLGSLGQAIHLGRGFFGAAKQLSCLSILVSVASTRSTACEWRKQQQPQKREIRGRTSLKRG
jgi:hypothetical protein